MDNKKSKYYSKLIPNFLDLCIDNLKRFYLPNHLMFARTAKLNPITNQLEIDSPDPRNTATALIALNRLKTLDYHVDFDTDKILHNLIQHYIDQIDYEDISLILWADSAGDKQYLDEIWAKLSAKCAFFINDPSGARYDTMRMAWLLTALCHYYPIANNQGEVQELADKVKKRIPPNFNSNTNLFYSSNRISRRNFIRAKYHNTLASLSSQTFTIMSLALYSQVFDDADVLQIATQCADTLCQLQGAQGQWWWVYNIDKGEVAEKYPVYSVNQDGAAPMALFALQRALSVNKYDMNIHKGLKWILGKNELNVGLVDWERRLIWRGIRRKERGKAGSFGLGLTGRLNAAASVYLGGINLEKLICRRGKFQIIKEMYSYHPARFILAFSDLL